MRASIFYVADIFTRRYLVNCVSSELRTATCKTERECSAK